jgi:nucleotide-binding universal stress UspA family protein
MGAPGFRRNPLCLPRDSRARGANPRDAAGIPIASIAGMIDIRRILCPIDFSETSRQAVDQAVAIAKWYGSEIVGLHVVTLPTFPTPPIIAAQVTSWGEPTPAERQAREEELRVWLEPAFAAGLRVQLIVDTGGAVSGILEAAARRAADFIVIGTHGLSGLDRFMLGSVAESVLRKASCPVLTVPPGVRAAAKVPYKRILCPVDFSKSSLAALEYAVSLAKEADADLTMLHVFEWPPEDDILYQQFDATQYHQSLERDARTRLEALVTDEVRTWCQPTTATAFGKPYREILAAAERESADLIVIGIRGRGALDLTMFGSTTNKVVRRAACPVLTLRG